MNNLLSQILLQRPKKFLAVDFTKTTSCIIYIERQENHFKLLAYDSRKILQSEERIEEILAGFIGEFVKKHGIHTKDIVLSVSEEDTVSIKYLLLPNLPQEEIVEAGKWQLKEEVPFELNDAIFSWQIIKEINDEEGVKKNGTVLVAAERKTVEKYLKVLERCHLNPLGIVQSSLNYSHILKHIVHRSPVAAVLDISRHDATLNIYVQNKLNLVRKLPFSLEKFVQSLTGILVTDKGRIAFTLEEAEGIAQTFGIPQDKAQIIKDNIEAQHMIVLIRPLLEVLIREIKFSFDYFASTFEGEKPATLYLAGEGANLKNLDIFIHQELNIPVSALPVPAAIDTPTLIKSGQNRLMSVLGAALGDFKSINLLPPEIMARQDEVVFKAFLRLLSITMALIFFLLIFITEFQIKDYSNRLNISQLHLRTIGSIEDLKGKVELKEQFLRQIQNSEVVTHGLLKTISMHIPHDVILDDISFSRSNLFLKGKVFAKEDAAETILAQFMEKLESSPFFREISLVSSKTAGSFQEFQMNCDLAH